VETLSYLFCGGLVFYFNDVEIQGKVNACFDFYFFGYAMRDKNFFCKAFQ
jgi:hypothetical protein